MPTSGSTDLTSSRDDIITEAMEYLGVLGEGDTPTAAQLTSMGRTLNYMVKHFSAVTGGTLWTMEKWFVFLKKTQREYTLSSTSSDNFCRAGDFIYTFLSAAASIGATSITVDDITGIADNDRIGIETSNNVIEWFDVSGTPSGSTINIDGGTGSGLVAAASIDGHVYTYTPPTSGDREMPLVLQDESCFLRTGFQPTDSSILVDIPIEVLPWSDYSDLSTKTSTGRPNQIFYRAKITQGDLFVWPTVNNEKEFLVLWAVRSIEDFDADTDEPDFPQEWFLPLAFNLAMFTMPKYGVGDREVMIPNLAKETRKDAMDHDTEHKLKIKPSEARYPR